jgi:Carboxypeptidase regulatory-like domain/TonB-dependent Receptor Plug Domain
MFVLGTRKTPAMSKLLYLVGVFLLSLSAAVVAQAQTSTVGSISGTVRDQKGSAVPNAPVVVREERTGLSRTVATDENGFFSVLSLPVGIYSVSAAPQGFKKTVNEKVELHVNENLNLNLVVQVGEVNETIVVTGETPQVSTTGGDVSSLVSEKQVTELPLNGRNYAALVTMIPGVSPANGGGFATKGTGLDSHVDMSVNGNQSNANLWTVDGVNNMDVGSNATLLVFPSIDSIQEFRVERNSFSAEYGQAQGAVINLVTKGGSNQFHGAAFEFFRNDVLNASDFILNSGNQPKQKLIYNNFGFNFNGPIKKDRIFFFWSEEWRRERRGTVLSAKVPTLEEREGNFSGLLTATRPKDPFLAGRCDPRGTVGGNFDACFPNDTIPGGRISPVGRALMNIFPFPNNPSDPTGTNWITSVLEPVNTRQDLIRGDVIINSKTNLMVRYINEAWDRDKAAGNFWGNSPFPTLSADWAQPSKSFAVKLTNTLTPTAINEFQFSAAGNEILVTTNQESEALNQDLADKFQTVFPRVAGTGFPTVGFGTDGYPTLWHQAPWENQQDLYVFRDDFSKLTGNHSLKFGALFSHNIKDEKFDGGSGLYTISAGNTRTNNLIAELLLRDLPVTQYTEKDHQEVTFGRWRDLEFYGNDTWKFSPRVTLTLGLRWSRYSPAYSQNNRMSNYILSRFDGSNPASGLVQADQADQAGLPSALVNAYNNGFQPRIGVAWDLFGDGKTALRLGAGRYLSRSNVIEDLLNMASNPPWTVTVDTGGQGNRLTLADCSTPCRSLDTIDPGLKDAALTPGPFTTFRAVSTDFRPPESWQWNLTISHELLKNTVVEASYIGNQGRHIWRRGVEYNDIVPSARLLIAQANRAPGGAGGDLINANRIRTGLGRVIGSESTGNSSYNAFQLWVNRRFSNRLAFQASYSWSHAITNVPLQSFTTATTDPFNNELDRGDADLDRRQIFVANAVYELPSFKGLGSIGSNILGDWQLNGIVSLLDGNPIDVISGANTAGLALAGTQRPNLVPGVPIYLDNGNPLQYLNPAAFALPGVGQFGSLGRGAIRGPGVANVDFSVNKNWRVRERYGLQFRAEMFNAFNRANFIFNNANNGSLSFNNTAASPTDPCDGTVSACGRPATNFGLLTSTRGPREIQFGLKFTF